MLRILNGKNLQPILLPREFCGQRNLVDCCPWGCTESDTTEATLQQQQQDKLPTRLIFRIEREIKNFSNNKN